MDNKSKYSPSARAIVGALIVLAAGVVGYLLYTESLPSSSDTDTRRIQIAQAGNFFLYAPLYVAIDEGYFREQGLDVSVVSTGGDDKTWATVLSGDAQFGIADPTFVAIAAQRGQGGRVVGNIVNGVPFWGVTLNDSIGTIDQPSELAPYTVGTFSAPSTAYVLQKRMFESAGLDPNIREGSFGAILPMLRAGKVDIGLELEPNVSQAVSNGASVAYSMSDIYGDFAITGLTTTPGIVNDEPDLIFDVTCALQKAMDHIHRKRTRSLNILLDRFTGINRDVASNALNRGIDDNIIPDNPITSVEAWKKNLNVRVSVGDLKQPENPSSFLVNRFSRRASRECTLDNS